MITNVSFQHTFCRTCLLQLDAAARRSITFKKEVLAINAGKEINDGDYSAKHLLTIAEWKSPRRGALINENKEIDVRDTLRAVSESHSAIEKVNALVRLRGVGVPMASAILTAIDPDHYTVIDIRVLDALGRPKMVPSAKNYEIYRHYCKKESARLGLTLRQFDRALWKAGSA